MRVQVVSVIVGTKAFGDEAIAYHCGTWKSTAMLPRGHG